MKEEAAVELKDFLCVNDYDIWEQLWQIWQYYQWWFHSAIVYSSFVKVDSAVKCIILSLQWWQSVPQSTNHLTVILWVGASDLSKTDDHQSFMVKAENILFVWQYNSLTVWSFLWKQQKTFHLWQYSESMWPTENHLWWRQITFYLCCITTYSMNDPFMECHHLSLTTYC